MNAYLTAIGHKLREISISHAQRKAIVAEQRSFLQEPDNARVDLTEELGTTTDYANCVAERVGEPSTLHRYLSEPLRVFIKSGRASLRNMGSPRILQPHLLGFGQPINWVVVATKLGTVRPNDIDSEIILETLARVMQATAFLPATATVAHGVASAVFRKQLPAKIHTKWKPNDEAAQKTTPEETLLFPLMASTVGAGFSAALLPKADDYEDILRVASLGAPASIITSSWLIGVLTGGNSKLNPALVQAGVAVASVAASVACLVPPLFAGLKATQKEARMA